MPITLLASLSARLLNLPRAYKRIATIVVDAALLFVSFYAALWLRFDFLYFSREYGLYSVIAVLSALCGMYLLGAYHFTLRSFNGRTLLSITGGIVLSIMAIGTIDLFFRILPAVLSRGFLVLYVLLAITMLALSRVLLRTAFGGGLFPETRRIPVIIIARNPALPTSGIGGR
jgi:FlaA1/EpsC-like NDP-sugar epimerase